MADPADDRGGDFLTVEQMAQLRRVTPAAIRAQLRAGTLAGQQVLQGQRTVWRIPASAARRDLAEAGGVSPAVEGEPEAPPDAPPAGGRPAAPVPPSDPEPAPRVTGRGAPSGPPSVSPSRVEALEAEVRRLRRQLAALADAHHRLLDALTVDLADDVLR
jgi:hypothetical protein